MRARRQPEAKIERGRNDPNSLQLKHASAMTRIWHRSTVEQIGGIVVGATRVPDAGKKEMQTSQLQYCDEARSCRE